MHPAFRHSTVVVAGATGNLGGRIATALAERGASVTALVRHGTPKGLQRDFTGRILRAERDRAFSEWVDDPPTGQKATRQPLRRELKLAQVPQFEA
jgi:NAD(P)-dependent dehydrogenase (short-subunit alcohol dehydrogenase family)